MIKTLKKCILLAITLVCPLAYGQSSCHSALWPENNFYVNSASTSQQEAIQKLESQAEKSLKKPAGAIKTLGSAGKTNKQDKDLIATRKAIQDADRAAVLALAYRINNNQDYLHKAEDILMNWAEVNEPTGNPIDETRLEGMIWAYDLIACHISSDHQKTILAWLEKLRIKKMQWEFGLVTQSNNHRIHQMKMLMLLDRVLHRTKDWERDIEQAKKYSLLNLNKVNGESIDYIQRNALHYHNYDLQAWLEISLLTDCCRKPVIGAFNFLKERIQTHKIDGEFIHSTAKIDGLRAKAGFQYTQAGGTFDVSKAASTIVTYYTIVPEEPPPYLSLIVEDAKPSLWLSFVINRSFFWPKNT